MKSQIKAGVILGYANMIANILVSLIYVPIMLKLMGQSEYGLYSLAASVVGYLSVLDMGFGNSMIRFISKSKAKLEIDEEKKINGLFLFLYTIIGIIALLIGIALIIFSEKIFKALTVEELYKTKIIMAILIGTVAISFPLSIFESYIVASEKFVLVKILNLIKTIMFPITILPLLFFGFKSITMVIVNSSYTLLIHLLNLYYCLKKLNMKFYFSFKDIDRKLLKNISAYSFFIFLNLIIDRLYGSTDQVILGAVSGTIAVSVYSLANHIITINTSFSTNISGVFFPRVTKTLEEENGEKKVSDIFIKVSRIQLYILALILSGFILFGKSFINIWVGKEYMDAYYIVLLIISSSIIPLTQNIGISIIQAMNKHKFRSVVYFFIAILNIFISIPLAKKYAGIGAAIGTLFATIIGQGIIMNIYYYKVAKIDIPKYWKWFLKFMIPLFLVTGILTYFTRNVYMELVKMIICGIGFIIFYVLYSYRFFNEEEKSYVYNIFYKVLKKENER